MTKAIVVKEFGGPENLIWERVEVGDLLPHEIRIKHTAIGLNYIDTYHRSGSYPLPLPFTPGLEAAAIIEAIGDDVTGLKIGDRVAYPTGPLGAYSQSRNIPHDRVVKVPTGVSNEDIAALLLKGCTVEFLTERLYNVKSGDTVLFHAAAGGVGTIACQWLSARGVTVIGTVGSDAKAEIAKANGCTHTINYSRDSFKDQVMEITSGKGVPVVFDSVGHDTFMDSLDCLSPRGMMVTFGNATGPAPAIAPGVLAAKGSLILTRPSLMHYCASNEDLAHSANRVMHAIAKGHIKSNIGQTFELENAADAHRALESRATVGQTILKT